jgi:hypothetical protein
VNLWRWPPKVDGDAFVTDFGEFEGTSTAAVAWPCHGEKRTGEGGRNARSLHATVVETGVVGGVGWSRG